MCMEVFQHILGTVRSSGHADCKPEALLAEPNRSGPPTRNPSPGILMLPKNVESCTVLAYGPLVTKLSVARLWGHKRFLSAPTFIPESAALYTPAPLADHNPPVLGGTKPTLSVPGWSCSEPKHKKGATGYH